MKNKRKLYTTLLFMIMLFWTVKLPVQTMAEDAVKTVSSTKKTGWVTRKGKTYYYLENGKTKTGWLELGGKKYYFSKKGVLQTGWQKIRKKTYYFNKKGVMLTGWQTIKKKKYYFGSDGALRKGLQTIGKKKYYFSTEGVMQTGWVNTGKAMYYFSKKTGAMDPTKKRKLSELEKKCESIVSKTVNAKDSNSVKLQKLFNYVTWNYGYYRTYGFSPYQGWDKQKALGMINSGSGNCYSYAALFGYLAKKATDLPVRVYYGSTPGRSVAWTPHGWCEVQINGSWRVFDPDLYRYVYKYNPQFCNGFRSDAYYRVGGYATVGF